MLDVSQKTPLARSLNQLAERRAHDAIQQIGKNLPASVVAVSGALVKVKFEVQGTTLPQVTCPVASPQYARIPIQVGDPGMVVSSDLYLGGVSGLGGGTASIGLPANLSAVLFIPLSNKGIDATEDPNKYIIYGPDGAIIRTEDKTVSVTASKTGVTIKAGNFSWLFTTTGVFTVPGDIQLAGSFLGANGATYAGSLQVGGNVIGGAGTGDQVGLLTHEHTSGGPGSPTSSPTPGT